MSERYVWDKYDTKSVYVQGEAIPQTGVANSSSATIAFLCNKFRITGNSYYADGDFIRIGTPNPWAGTYQAYALAADYRYAIFANTILLERKETTGYWRVSDSGSSSSYRYALGQYTAYSGGTLITCTRYNLVQDYARGDTLQGQASSSARNTYPDDGASGSNWYIYKGSDNIDPVSISYSTNRPEWEKPVTVTAEPHEEVFEWNIANGPLHGGGYYGYGTCIAYGGGKFVAAPFCYYEDETPGAAAYSADGVNWSTTSIPVNGNFGYNQIAYGNGKFVAVGNKSAYSADGTTWTEMGAYPGGVTLLSGVAFGNGRFVGIETTSPGGILGAYSTDGINWNFTELPASKVWEYIAYGGNRFVVLGRNGETAYSADGQTWNLGTSISMEWPNALKYCNGKFYAISSNKAKPSYCSSDGLNWSVANIPNDCTWISIAYGGGKYILISEYDGSNPSKYAISEDGENWTVDTININGTDDNGLVYSNDKFVCFEAYGKRIAYTTAGYGGTVSYQYQYSLNGGSTWINAGGVTTATEKDITVPRDAEHFMARVRAQDGWGFVSNDYVTGSNLEVQAMRLWVGVGNVAKQGRKLWIGVDGKARQAVRAWVGDENGKARRWF